MAELRGDDFTGGYVLRRYEPFAGAEVRTWWIGGACRLVTAHPDSPQQPPPDGLDLTALHPAIAGLGLPFVTVDLARRTDGVWRISSSSATTMITILTSPSGNRRPATAECTTL